VEHSNLQLLDADKSGVVELNDIIAKYDGTKHPDVIAGKRTNEEVLREFMSTFDTDGDGKVRHDLCFRIPAQAITLGSIVAVIDYH
jgi:Ca2+-binding EF-hand superfamily protein